MGIEQGAEPASGIAVEPPLLVAYQEVSKLFYAFIDWRHKVLSRYAVVVAGIVVGEYKLYNDHQGTIYKQLLSAVGMFVSLIAALMDARNTRILMNTYEVGKLIEDDLYGIELAPRIGVFSRLYGDKTVDDKEPWYISVLAVKYRLAMLLVYIFGLLCFLAAIVVAGLVK